MPKKAGIIFVILGVVLMMSALLLFFYNGLEDRNAQQEAESLLDDIQSVIEDITIPETTEPTTENETEGTEPVETLDPEMPTLLIDGYEYIGYVSIPDLELELPVMAEWDFSRLKVAPCRHFGSSRADDLVIAAHNYKSHFGYLKNLEIGAEILFTDMDGIENRYTLTRLETLPPDAVDAVQNSGHDLVLYSCTPGGATRVTAFCARVEEVPPDKGGSQGGAESEW